MATLDRDWNFVVREFEPVEAGDLCQNHLHRLMRRRGDTAWRLITVVEQVAGRVTATLQPDAIVVELAPRDVVDVETPRQAP
ncbi:hypothetical protein B8281_16035 [Cellulosimicrobium sp. TH-20]|uniref:hypothetical protein n=1 Tax=Cellulosimicrobium sp. TH-20 TaxID=1980001 RepID=UPI000A17C280|nr:hypothetical protein [Cellulosimicrobium sp. TH-20]ARK06002.1 hypothetical protein B8281_16035 [Cellulosimicrobium sp. TH-20]